MKRNQEATEKNFFYIYHPCKFNNTNKQTAKCNDISLFRFRVFHEQSSRMTIDDNKANRKRIKKTSVNKTNKAFALWISKFSIWMYPIQLYRAYCCADSNIFNWSNLFEFYGYFHSSILIWRFVIEVGLLDVDTI